MRYPLLIFILIFSTPTFCQTKCKCTNDEKNIHYKDVIVCGNQEKDALKNAVCLSAITIRNCSTGKILMSTQDDELATFKIDKIRDTLIITELQLIPNSSMNGLIYVPFTERKVVQSALGKTILTKGKFVFRIPKLSAYQKHYLDSLCQKLKSEIHNPTGTYPSDEQSIYNLFLGALTKYNDCYDLFVNAEKYFMLDGAIKETFDEIPFTYIEKHLSKK